ncbi:heavy metal-associated domain-containing protein [Frankia sp. RB7]|nr:heavy metal-associated domain-containing protein [Frankia sp. RB7]
MLAHIEELIQKRDAAHKAFVDAQNARVTAWNDYQTAQDDLCGAIEATGTNTYIDEAGNEHRARRGGLGTVQTTKASTHD